MVWFIIILVLAAAFGPVFWLRPSQRDKRLNMLRAQARQEDLVVSMETVPLLNPSPEQRVSAAGKVRDTGRLVARYNRQVVRPFTRLSPWCIWRAPSPAADPTSGKTTSLRPAIDVVAGWIFDPDSEFPPPLGWPQSLEALAGPMSELPIDVIGIVVEARSIGVYWQERVGTGAAQVTQLAATLK